MTNSIFCDYDKLFNTDKKLYLGNKLLHIFFLIGLAHENKLDFKLPKNASINMIFQQDTNIFHEEIKKERKLKLFIRKTQYLIFIIIILCLKKKLLI